MTKPPLTESHQLDIEKHQINKMVNWGSYTPPKDWEPYKVSADVLDRLR